MSAGDDWAVDVVIPVRDGARFLPACLDSVMAQTLGPRAVIVADDGSTDATPQILAEYAARWSKLTVLWSEPRGVSHARNRAIRVCAAPYIAFLDSDDVWAPEKLERQMAIFSAAKPSLGFVYCAYRCIDMNGEPLEDHRITEPRLRGNVFRNLLLEGNAICGSSSAVVARRDLLERVSGFDERLSYGEDWDLWLKLAAISEADFVPERLVAIRTLDGSAQRSGAASRGQEFLLQTLLALDRWYGLATFPPELTIRYRTEAVHLATRSKTSGLSLFRRLETCDSRFGRELFAGMAHFLFAVYRRRLTDALRGRTHDA